MKRKRKKHLAVEWRAVEMIERYSSLFVERGKKMARGALKFEIHRGPSGSACVE